MARFRASPTWAERENMHLSFNVGDIVWFKAKWYEKPIIAKIIKIDKGDLTLCEQLRLNLTPALCDEFQIDNNRCSVDSKRNLLIPSKIVIGSQYAYVNDIPSTNMINCDNAEQYHALTINKYDSEGFCKG